MRRLVIFMLVFVSFTLDNIISQNINVIQSSFFDMIFLWLTNLFSIIVILLLMTSLFLWEENKTKWILPLWLSFFITGATSYLIKTIITRPRPLIDASVSAIGYSFPSSHAALSFAAVPILDKEFPKLKWFWIIFASLVSLSRIYFNVHYLSDIVFGAAIGFWIGCLLSKEKVVNYLYGLVRNINL